MNYNSFQIKLNSKQSTEKQKEVIENTHYPIYLKAGAGTGKTEVLIDKIFYILGSDGEVGLENFAIITFTNKATDEMRERLGDRLYFEWLKHNKTTISTGKIKTGAYMRRQVGIRNILDISTIHGFCEKLLRKYGLNIGLPLNFKIKSIRKDVTDIIESTVNRYYSEEILRGIPQYKLVKLLDIFMQDNNNRGFRFDREFAACLDFNTPDNDYWNRFKVLFVQMYLEISEEVEKFKRDESILTTDDLIKKASELLKNEYVLDKVSQQYKYVFIDEFQDTNKDQFNLVNSLLDKNVKVFLVGDEKQAIYAFRGSDVQNSKDMSGLVTAIQSRNGGDAQDISMNENFRTDYVLLEKINKIFEHDFRFMQRVEFPNAELDKVDSLKDPMYSEEAPLRITFERDVVDIINHLVNNERLKNRNSPGGMRNITYGDIAVLCRSNFDLDRLAQELKNDHIPVEVIGGKGFYKSKEIIDTFKLFNSVINKGEVYRTELFFTDYYYAVTENKNNLDFEKFLEELDTVFRQESVEGILNFIYSETYIEDYYRSERRYQEIANLQKLKDKARDLMAKEFMQPMQFLEYLNVMIMSGQEEDDADIAEMDRDRGVVSLYSIHKAKGLSFPVVIVPKFDKKLNRPIMNPKIIFHNKPEERKMIAFGHEYLGDDVEDEDLDYANLLDQKIDEFLQEEIRILYVALTRAKHMLIMACEKSRAELRLNRRRDDHASWAKWIAEIDNGSFMDEHVMEL